MDHQPRPRARGEGGTEPEQAEQEEGPTAAVPERRRYVVEPGRFEQKPLMTLAEMLEFGPEVAEERLGIEEPIGCGQGEGEEGSACRNRHIDEHGLPLAFVPGTTQEDEDEGKE